MCGEVCMHVWQGEVCACVVSCECVCSEVCVQRSEVCVCRGEVCVHVW